MRPLNAEQLVRAYSMGVFPMARHRDDSRLYWIDPEERGILPLESFHLPRSLKKAIRHQPFDIRIDTAFGAVMELCAETTEERTETWINDEIVRLFLELHSYGMAHSVEAWDGGQLVGGLYGLSLGAAFFGESMFSRATNASKIPLAYLVAGLRRGGYKLLDTQFVTTHLAQFGTIEIPRRDYLQLLADALALTASFPATLSADEVLAELG